MADIYNAADVFVNLTRFDTLPTVNMESICCGTPVITFDVGGGPEIIDRDDGFVVPEGDFNAVVNALHKVKYSPFSYSIETKRIKFDKKERYKDYIELYRSLI